MFELMLERHFCAAHHLLNYIGKCATPHGHNYKVRLYAQSSTLDDAGISIDFATMKQVLDPLLESIDHQDLNVHPWFEGLSPSAEVVAKVLYAKIRVQLPEITKICIYETDTQAVCYTPSA
jgi:6-pyruvoyltetrahydropterin/6-carboxytetrahydropterin synthase